MLPFPQYVFSHHSTLFFFITKVIIVPIFDMAQVQRCGANPKPKPKPKPKPQSPKPSKILGLFGIAQVQCLVKT
jgi:hypothetical protein